MENPLNAAGCRREPIVDVPGDGALSGGLGGIKICLGRAPDGTSCIVNPPIMQHFQGVWMNG